MLYIINTHILGFPLACVSLLMYFYICCMLHREEKCTFLSWFNLCGQAEVVSMAGTALHCCAPVSSAAAWAQRVCYCATEGAEQMGCCSKHN